jgi:FkbM family methyltransferase
LAIIGKNKDYKERGFRVVNLLLIIYKKIFGKLISSGLIRTKTFVVNGNKIKFHDIKKNNLLKSIAINGFESHENETIKLIKNYKWRMNNFYDIGSNIGHYAVIASLYHKTVNVTAVEPFPLNSEYIDNLKFNNKLSFSLINKAVDSTTGVIKDFYFPVSKNSSKLPGTGTLINSFKGSGGTYNDLPFEIVQVETITLDELTKDIDGSALIKMDCEGNEFRILKSSSLLAHDNVDFIIEIMINDSDKEEIFTLMMESGYNGFLITNAGLILENRPLTLPRPDRNDRTLWRNHFFTKKPILEIQKFSIENYGHWI